MKSQCCGAGAALSWLELSRSEGAAPAPPIEKLTNFVNWYFNTFS